MKYKQKGILAENNWKPIGSFLRRPPMILIIVLELLALLFLGYRTCRRRNRWSLRLVS